jgi:LIM domain-containing protein 1
LSCAYCHCHLDPHNFYEFNNVICCKADLLKNVLKCRVCRSGITGEHIVLQKFGRIHVKCAKCRICSKRYGPATSLMDRDGLLYCKKHYDQFFATICDHCKQNIQGGAEISAVGKYFHPDHFFCQGKCQKNFTPQDRYFVVDNKPYCAEDFKEVVPKCPICTESVFETTAISVGGSVYHPNCLSCEKCNAKYAVGMNFFQGSEPHKFLCLKDYSEANLKPCKACGEQIISPFDSMLFSGTMYHKKCFVCTSCPKTAGYLDSEGKKYCRSHYEKDVLKKCIVCDTQMRVDGEFLKIVGKGTVHRGCANCSTCQAALTVETMRFSKSKANQLVCQNCFANETGNVKCYACEEMITKGSIMTVQKVTFHKECLKCQVCQVDLVGQKLMIIKNKPRCTKHLRP